MRSECRVAICKTLIQTVFFVVKGPAADATGAP